MRTLFHAAALAMFSTLAVAQSPLTTTFLNNNGGAVGGGVYFDLTVNAPITVTSLDLNLTGTGTVDVFGIVPGTRTGNQNSIVPWTLLGSGTVTGAVAGVPTNVAGLPPIGLPVGTHGIALRANGCSHNYTNGTGANQTVSTAELTLNAGEANNAAFGAGLFTPRVVNCTIGYTVGSGFATRTNYGAGCGGSSCYASIYEAFAVGAMDLSNTTISHVGGAVFIPGGTPFTPPGVGAASLALTDDSEAVRLLANPFPLPCGGFATQLNVCSNGFISTATNGVSFAPAVATFLAFANTSWACWHDYLPNATNNVMHEVVGTSDVFTWNAVPDFGAAGTSTWQVAFDSSGTVEFRFGAMSTLGNNYVFGYSPGGPNLDPGSLDMTTGLPQVLCCSDLVVPGLTLTASARPIIGTNIGFTTSSIPAGVPFGALLVGFAQFNPGIPLPPAPGCVQHNEWLANFLFFGPGASVTQNPAFMNAVPNFPGLNIQFQSAVYTPGGPGLGLTSNGVAMGINVN